MTTTAPATMTPRSVEQGLARLQQISNDMAAMRESIEALGHERRHLMLRLNRSGRQSYATLREHAGINQARVNSELAKAREEAGVADEPHPRGHDPR